MRIASIVVLAGCGITSIEVRERAKPTETAPPFTLPAHDGSTFTPHGDVVLVFYRGHW